MAVRWGGKKKKKKWLTFSTGNTHALGFHLIAETTFVFP